MKGIFLAVFLGWAGGYRFYKKQTVLGIVYLFTIGIFGIGWIADIVIAIRDFMPKKLAPIVTTCEIKGGFAKCKKDGNIMRKDVLKDVSVGQQLIIEEDIYEGKPYYLICAPNGMDLGAMPREINAMIRNERPKAALSAVLKDKKDLEKAYMTLTIK